MDSDSIANTNVTRGTFAILVGFLHVILGRIDELYVRLADIVPQVWIFTAKPLVALGDWFGLWGASPSWSIWLYGIAFLVIGIVEITRESRQARTASAGFIIANLVVYWLLYLWNDWGRFGEFLVGDIGYTILMGSGGMLFLADLDASKVIASSETAEGQIPSTDDSGRSEGNAAQSTGATANPAGGSPKTDETTANQPPAGDTGSETGRGAGTDQRDEGVEATTSARSGPSRAKGMGHQAGVAGRQADLVSLSADEYILGNVTFYWSNWWREILLSVIVLLLGAGLIRYDTGENGAILGVVLVLVAVGMLALVRRAREKSGCVITSERIVLSEAGLLASKTTEVRMEDIRSILTTQSGVQSLLNTGRVKVDTGAGEINIGARNVDELAAVIRREKNRQSRR